jgi:AraC-like DNA-binding protein
MNEFELIARDGEDIEFVAEIPEAYKKYHLAGSTGFMAQCSFGDMLFWHHKGDGFDIWKSIYDINRNARVTGRTDSHILELTAMYEHSFDINWKNVVKGNLPFKQIELYFSPGIENEAFFTGGKRCGTIDIHFQPAMLEAYAKEFPLLDVFMDKVHNNKAARLFNALQFSCPRMDNVLREMIQYSYIDALAPRYFDSYVNILLILLLERISGFHPLARTFSPSDLEKANEARRILSTERITDNDKPYTIGLLCRRLGTNPYKLKTSFKHAFGMSIGKYKQTVFMDFAKQLIIEGNNSFDEIAMMLGYRSQQSFTTAFRNHFKQTPGYFRKHKT